MIVFLRSAIIYVLILMAAEAVAQKVEIHPEYPERGQLVTVSFTPGTGAESINDRDTGVTLVFTFSNLYDLPYRVPMEKKGDRWQTSFRLARYATYATFTLESGNKVQKPAPDKHYPLAIYQKGKRIFSGYLYESYSLPAQMGKDPRVPALQASLLQKELQLHPDNYEAKVRFLHNKMNQSSGKEKEKYRQQALDVIAANFYKDPGNPGLMNKTTMGYLIIGEKTRVDSIRKVIRDKYPDTEAGYDMRIGEIREIADSETRKNKAEAMLKTVPPARLKFVTELHDILLEYYAEKKNEKTALYHLNALPADTSPYRGETLLKRARLLMQNGVLLDTALIYSERAFAIAAEFPAGLIRYFPETGHILPYVNPETKKNVERTAQGNSLSLKALILLKKGDAEKGKQILNQALDYSSDAETLSNAGWYYRQTGDMEKAYQVTKKLVMENQEDTAAQRLMKEDYAKWKNSEAGWNEEWKQVEENWRSKIMAVLKKERMNKKAPVIENLVNIKGEPVTASAMAGKIVVIDFWATWCVPCMKEMPYLQKVYEKYKNNPKVMFMVLNSGSGNTLADAQAWPGNKEYSFPVYYTNDKKLGEKFGFNVIPATYVIDPSGNIQFKTIGFEGPSIEFKLAGAIDLLLSE